MDLCAASGSGLQRSTRGDQTVPPPIRVQEILAIAAHYRENRPAGRCQPVFQPPLKLRWRVNRHPQGSRWGPITKHRLGGGWPKNYRRSDVARWRRKGLLQFATPLSFFLLCSDGGLTAHLAPHCLLKRSASARTIGGVAACPCWAIVTASLLLSRRGMRRSRTTRNVTLAEPPYQLSWRIQNVGCVFLLNTSNPAFSL